MEIATPHPCFDPNQNAHVKVHYTGRPVVQSTSWSVSECIQTGGNTSQNIRYIKNDHEYEAAKSIKLYLIIFMPTA